MTNPTSESAKAILATFKNNFSSINMIRVNAKEFGHLDLPKYRNFREAFTNAGFRYICDAEIPTVSAAPNSLIAPTMIRNMLSEDGKTLAQYYQIRPNHWRVWKNFFRGIKNLRWINAPKLLFRLLKTRHCLNFETEFEDGRQLITSNAEAAGMLSEPEKIETLHLPYDTPKELLYAIHLTRVKEIALETPARSNQTFIDVIAMQRRQTELKREYRRSINFVTRDELVTMSGGNEVQADEIYEEIGKLLRQEREREAELA